LKLVFASTILFTCNVAQAHSGHDHEHWLISPIHQVTILAVACMIAVAYKLTRNKVLDKREEK
jgi:hypothetical protein